MPRFVILQHDTPSGAHFDFMLASGDALKTWSLPAPPQPGVTMECEALADHRLAYLDYEGPVSGDRGSVARWDRGEYTTEQRGDTMWIVRLVGDKVTGTVTLRRQPGTSNRWQFELAGG
jgi:hypothetical protein